MVQSELADKGMTFTHGFVVNPLCCPSRTTILTGRYSHHTGVYRNSLPYGGFPAFGTEDRSTIATWLRGGGYRTAMVGKYLNGYNDVHYVPPGWDTWDALVTLPYYNYRMSINGEPKEYGGAEADYQTYVLGRYSTDFIKSVPPNRPLFLYLAPHAPHAPATPPARYRGALATLPLYRPPNYNQPNVTNSPSWVKRLHRLGPVRQHREDLFREHQFESLLAVDDVVGDVLRALQQTDRLSNTLIVFASDNGLEQGSHRWLHKADPYEGSINVPIIIRYDPVTRLVASFSDRFALNMDFSPTFAAAARVEAPGVDGRSLLPLLDGSAISWRADFLIEHVGGDRAPTSFCAVRNASYIFVEYRTHEEELYDLDADPFELRNLAKDQGFSAIRSQMHARLLKLCSPPPPDFTGWPW